MATAGCWGITTLALFVTSWPAVTHIGRGRVYLDRSDSRHLQCWEDSERTHNLTCKYSPDCCQTLTVTLQVATPCSSGSGLCLPPPFLQPVLRPPPSARALPPHRPPPPASTPGQGWLPGDLPPGWADRQISHQLRGLPESPGSLPDWRGNEDGDRQR